MAVFHALIRLSLREGWVVDGYLSAPLGGLAPLSAAAVGGAYDVDPGVLESGLQLDSQRKIFRWTEAGGEDLGWSVELFSMEGRPVTPRDRPISRVLRANARVYGRQGRGKVGELVSLCLTPDFQRKGLGTLLRGREETLMETWGAEEIHLQAGCDALATGLWLRKGFNITPQEHLLLSMEWDLFQEYELERGEDAFEPLPAEWENWHAGFQSFVHQQRGRMSLYRTVQ